MKSTFTRKLLPFLILIFTIAWNPICKSQSQLTHELKPGFIGTNYISSLGLLYEIIPNKRFGYELGIVPYTNTFSYSCVDGSCDNFESYKMRYWAFILSAKYYLSKEHRPSKWYVGAFLLYSTEVQASISDKFRERLTQPSPIDLYLLATKNRLSPGGIVGYKWQLGQHLLIEPSLSVGINVTNLYSIDADLESLLMGRIGWRF